MAVLAGLTFGLAPALQIPSGGLQEALKETGRGSTEGRKRSVDSQRAGRVRDRVCLRAPRGRRPADSKLPQVLDVNLGFQPERTAALRVDPDSRYSTQDQQNAYFDEVLRRVKDVPGIEAAGLTDALPLGRNRSWGAAAKGQVYREGRIPTRSCESSATAT